MIYIDFEDAAVSSAGYWDPTTTTNTWTLSDSDKTAHADAWPLGGMATVLGVGGRSTGKYYLEIYIIDTDGAFGSSVRHDFGITFMTFVGAGGSGLENGAGYRRAGVIMINNTDVGTVTQLFGGDVVGVAVDLDSGDIWFSYNGTWTQGDPSAGTSPEGSVTTGETYRPFISTESPINTHATLRISTTEFSYSVPTGFTQWAG